MDRNELERKYNLSRINLIILVGLSVVNIITLVLNDTYFFFSLAFPRNFQLVVSFLGNSGLMDGSLYTKPILLLIMILPIILFLLCYIFSNNLKYRALLWAIILFAIDCIFTLITFEVIDIIFHAYIMFILIVGYRSGRGIAKLDASIEIFKYHEDE